uniref:Ig-like domain-containing protein n=1 Tax=Varanus komodoensis TaxID=61221 RepID=A0A8D2L7Z1_VARKO
MAIRSVSIMLTLASFGVLQGNAEIIQGPVEKASERQKLDLQCQHPSVSTENILWYQQLPGHGPRFIVSGYQGETRSSVLEGVSLHIPADRKSSTLSFARVTLADSALYFCALSDTVLHPAGSAVQKASSSGSRFQGNQERA